MHELWRLVSRFPRAILLAATACTIASTLFTAAFLKLDSNQDSLVSPQLPFHKRYLDHLKNFGDQEYFYVVVRTDGTDPGKRQAVQFAEKLVSDLRRHPELFRQIHYKLSAADFGRTALLFASIKEVETLSSTILSLAPKLNQWTAGGDLSVFIDMLAAMLNGADDTLAGLDTSLIDQGLALLYQFLQNLDRAVAGEASAEYSFDLENLGAHYFFTANGRLLVLRILPAKDYQTLDVVKRPLQVLRQILDAQRSEFTDIQAGLTGRPVLQADEMQTTNRDMTVASLTAVFLLGVIFTLILQGWLKPLLILASLAMAVSWTFAFATLSLGRLNLLSIVFTLVLVGIGVDFGVHVVLRYVECRRDGLDNAEAVRTAMLKTGPGITLGALTSVCAFYAVVGSDFRGLAELGLIGGTGILFSLCAMLTVLPALLLTFDKSGKAAAQAPRLVVFPFFDRLLTRPFAPITLLALVSVAALPGLLELRFSYNLLELQAHGLESVEYEKLLLTDSNESTWFATMTAADLEEAAAIGKQLENLPSVGKVETLLDFFPTDQERKAALLAKAASALQPDPVGTIDPATPAAADMIGALQRLGFALENLEEKLFAVSATQELAAVGRSLQSLQSLLQRLQQGNPELAGVNPLQIELRQKTMSAIVALKELLSAEAVNIMDIPLSIRELYVGMDGRQQLKISPSDDVWDFDKLRHFVADLRRVDPNVSGVPVGVLEAAQLMHRAFLSAAAVTIVLVSLLLFTYSRSIGYVLLALLPLSVSLVWLFECMGWAGINFNLANFFAVPILIAIGVDGGVHFLARWQELQCHSRLFSTSTPTAVGLSFTTTMIGFGGLLFAHHRGLASLGALMVLGSVFGLMACMLVLPAVLEVIGRRIRKGENR